MTQRRFIAVDIETTGLNPEEDQIIEVGLVWDGGETEFTLPFELEDAKAEALAINGWGNRPFPNEKSEEWASGFLYEALRDRHIVGKNPQFDVSFIRVLLEMNGLKPTWHHRLVDVGSLAWGWGNGNDAFAIRVQPPNIDQVAESMWIPRETVAGYHTALNDARWAYKVFRTIVPIP